MNILGAPTNLGNRPYDDDGTARLTTLGPARLRDAGVVQRLGAHDLGDVIADAYRDFVRPPGGIRNADLVLRHVRAIARRLQEHEGFTLLLGGDCSVLPGALLGLNRGRDVGLIYIDAHSDLGTEETTTTGGAAGMDLAFVVGLGRSELTRLAADGPLVKEENVVAIGVRDGSFRGTKIRTAATAEDALSLLEGRDFFIHLDVDVLDPKHFPFVDSPEPGGMSPDQLLTILTPLVRHPRAVGMEMTIYDPKNDHDGRGAELLVSLLERAFGKASPARA